MFDLKFINILIIIYNRFLHKQKQLKYASINECYAKDKSILLDDFDKFFPDEIENRYNLGIYIGLKCFKYFNLEITDFYSKLTKNNLTIIGIEKK
jgi:hypothetical protein